jgi:hypothetical protein
MSELQEIILTSKYYTTKEACLLLDIANTQTIRRYIKLNLLRAKKYNNREWLITADSIAEKLIRQGKRVRIEVNE